MMAELRDHLGIQAAILFSCEDAAQQVLMSCLSVCLSVRKLKFYLLTAFNATAECS